MKLLLASRNAHKLEEIRSIFVVPGLAVVTTAAYPDLPEVVEDGVTFEANAEKKAVCCARATGEWALADDSGLEVDALDGAPGVRSARYAGEPVDYDANNRKLLAALAGRSDRAARFRCVIALSDPAGSVRTVAGVCEGVIARECRGRHGFGYDPLFVPAGRAQTFAELAPSVKNAISHRARALAAAAAAWSGLLAG